MISLTQKKYKKEKKKKKKKKVKLFLNNNPNSDHKQNFSSILHSLGQKFLRKPNPKSKLHAPN